MSSFNQLLHILFTKVGSNKGSQRIWLETQRLKDAGFDAGAHYRVEEDEQSRSIKIILDHNGARLVSKRTRNEKVTPIIDINSTRINEIFGKVEKIKACFYQDYIEIEVHPDEAARAERLERIKAKVAAGETLDVGAVSVGLGILDHAVHQGLKDQGINTRMAYGVELEKDYLEASLMNNEVWDKNSISICGGMEEVDFTKLPQTDVAIGGIPCTGASSSGKSKLKIKHAEQHPTAGHLFVSFVNFVKASNAAIVILENVPNFSSTMSMQVIRSCMEQWGYDIHEMELDSHELGTIERRKRFVMVGVTKGMNFNPESIVPVREREASLNNILDTFADDDPIWKEYDYLIKKEVKDKAAGKGFMIPRFHGGETACNTITRHYAKVQSTGVKIMHPTDPNKMRQLTVAEHRRAKAVPEELLVGITSQTLGHQMLGQGVAYPVFQSVGRALGKMLKGSPSQVLTKTIQSIRPVTPLHSVNDGQPQQMALAM